LASDSCHSLTGAATGQDRAVEAVAQKVVVAEVTGHITAN